MINIMDRIRHNKHADTTKRRVRERIEGANQRALKLLKEGKLEPVEEVKMINTEEDLDRYINLIKSKKIYVLDFETTGLNIWKDIIVGVALYIPGKKPGYVPINHTDLNGNVLKGQLREEYVKRKLIPVLTNKEYKIILHNAKYDAKIFYGAWGHKLGNIYWDTMIAHHILNENEPKGLKYLYQKYINPEDSGMDFSDIFDNNFNFAPLEVATIYGANDGIKTWQLYQFQKEWLNPNHKLKQFRDLALVFHHIEMDLLPHVIDMELRGVELDTEHLKNLEKQLKAEVEGSKKAMDDILEPVIPFILQNEELNRLSKGTGKINYGSYKQVQLLLYDVLKLPEVDKRNPRGTGEDILKKLENTVEAKTVKTLLRELLNYKEKNKLLTSFASKLPEEIEERTGAVHSQFNQTGTVTGRFSSNSPNLQQIPSRGEWGGKIRQAFKAREGYVLIGSDFSQIEPRTLASIVYKETGGEDMYKAYEEGKDLYVMMASRIYNLPESECMEFDEEGNFQPEGNMRRDSVKSVLLGIMYERGSYAIAEQFGKSKKWADNIVYMFIKTFPHIEKYRRMLVFKAEQTGFTTTITGRKRRLPEMKLKNPRNPKYRVAHRQVLNSVIQGSAGDILKLSMIQLARNERFKEIDAHILLTIHDEIIIEAPKEHAEEAGKILSETMKDVGKSMLGIPMKCDVEIMERWGE